MILSWLKIFAQIKKKKEQKISRNRGSLWHSDKRLQINFKFKHIYRISGKHFFFLGNHNQQQPKRKTGSKYSWFRKMSSEANVSVFAPNETISKNAYVSSFEQYQELYKKSIDDPQSFWGEIAKQFYWEAEAKPAEFFSYNFDIRNGPIYTKWMNGASTNLSYNLLDRNVKNGLADQIAYYW